MVCFRLACLVHLVLLISTIAAQATNTAASYTSLVSSPTLIQQDFSYDPSKVAAGIFAALYGIITFIFIISFRLFANRALWGLCLPIGAAFMTAGFILRAIMTIYPDSFPVYLMSQLFILLSPAAFLAFNYILYGQFIVKCVERCHSLIRPERTAGCFVISDLSTLLIQGVGGSMMTISNTRQTGIYIVIGGLSLQTLSFGIYTFLVYHMYRSMKRDGVKPFEAPWGKVLKMLFFTSSCFLFRCIYRTIEFGEGLGHGYLIEHEVFLYMFDALPLFIGISMYAVCWPTRYLKASSPSSDEMSAFIPLETPYDP